MVYNSFDISIVVNITFHQYQPFEFNVLYCFSQAVFGDDLGTNVSANITTNALYTAADILTGIGKIIAPIVNTITGIPKLLLSVATGILPGATAFQSLVNNMIQALSMTIASTLGQMLRFAGTGVGGVTSLIGSVLGTIQKVAGQGIRGGLNVTGSIADLISTSLNSTMKFGNGILNIPLKGLTTATNALSGLFDTTQGMVSSAEKAATNAIQTATDSTSKTIQNLAEQMRNRISSSG